MSKKALWCTISSTACGDTKPPCQIPGLSTQEQQEESEVFDRAIDDLCSIHWANASLMDTHYTNPCEM